MQKNAVLPVQRGYVPATTIGKLIFTAGGGLWDGKTLQDTPIPLSITRWVILSLPSPAYRAPPARRER